MRLALFFCPLNLLNKFLMAFSWKFLHFCFRSFFPTRVTNFNLLSKNDFNTMFKIHFKFGNSRRKWLILKSLELMWNPPIIEQHWVMLLMITDDDFLCERKSQGPGSAMWLQASGCRNASKMISTFLAKKCWANSTHVIKVWTNALFNYTVKLLQ